MFSDLFRSLISDIEKRGRAELSAEAEDNRALEHGFPPVNGCVSDCVCRIRPAWNPLFASRTAISRDRPRVYSYMDAACNLVPVAVLQPSSASRNRFLTT
jgi:hypothetical protein